MIKSMERKALPVIMFLAVFVIMLLSEFLSWSVSAILLILIGGIIGIFSCSFTKKARKAGADK